MMVGEFLGGHPIFGRFATTPGADDGEGGAVPNGDCREFVLGRNVLDDGTAPLGHGFEFGERKKEQAAAGGDCRHRCCRPASADFQLR